MDSPKKIKEMSVPVAQQQQLVNWYLFIYVYLYVYKLIERERGEYGEEKIPRVPVPTGRLVTIKFIALLWPHHTFKSIKGENVNCEFRPDFYGHFPIDKNSKLVLGRPIGWNSLKIERVSERGR